MNPMAMTRQALCRLILQYGCEFKLSKPRIGRRKSPWLIGCRGGNHEVLDLECFQILLNKMLNFTRIKWSI
jgi:hypothetical protein